MKILDVVMPYEVEDTLNGRVEAAIQLGVDEVKLLPRVARALDAFLTAPSTASLRELQKNVALSRDWSIGKRNLIALSTALYRDGVIGSEELVQLLATLPLLDRRALSSIELELVEFAEHAVEDLQDGVMGVDDEPSLSRLLELYWQS